MSLKRDFIEIERLDGWIGYREKIEESIAATKRDLQNINTGLHRTAEEIGIEYLKLESYLGGLERALNIVEEIKNEEADDI